MITITPELVAELAQVDGDLVILGVGGKIGPTLAQLAKRAAPGKRVVGVARFSEKGLRERLSAKGIECIEASGNLDMPRYCSIVPLVECGPGDRGPEPAAGFR